jgi:adenine phosphoribosyltransferase
MSGNKKVEDYVRTIPDFPEEGIMFRDITTVVQYAEGFQLAIDTMQDLVKDLGSDVIIGAESRGFVFGAPIAYNQHKPLVLVRKKGKLPGKTISVDYTLEYGSVTTLEIHEDSIKPGQKVLLIDDLLATGGTVRAMAQLVEKLGGEVAGILVLLELAGLNGRELLKDYKVYSAVSYPGK